jgi:hypothetical protein
MIFTAIVEPTVTTIKLATAFKATLFYNPKSKIEHRTAVFYLRLTECNAAGFLSRPMWAML